MGAGMKVTSGPGGREFKTEKTSNYYREIAQKLIPFTSVDTVDGEQWHLCERLLKTLEGLKLPTDVIPIMERKGLLKINEKDPESYYIFPDGLPKEEIPPLTTKTLQKIAKRLYRRAQSEPENKELRFLSQYLIEINLNTWHYPADDVFNQLKAKGYLVEKKNGEQQHNSQKKFFYIFSTQKQGLKFKNAA